ncbi:MAG: toll/interleukin-1 receptor domain-containing protein [Armatimonadetes bacterium]|nr:toll/interleukin-1 receptor domain-containing protein [Armatimonadota bacterium]
MDFTTKREVHSTRWSHDLSEHSVSSQWVEQEVETALEEEWKRGKTVLFPVRLDDAASSVDKGWPNIPKNSRHIGDFTNWKDHDSYQHAFDCLLRDLKAG